MISTDIFTDWIIEDLNFIFGKNDLNVQYSLGYCQGDGLNIYGFINAENILDCLKKHNTGAQLKEFENILTEKETRTILNYAENCGKIEIPQNRHYCYSLADYIEFADNWENELYYAGYKNINTEAINKFEKLVKEIFGKLDSDFETDGYNYFYEIEDDELSEICDCNNWEFTENGNLY